MWRVAAKRIGAVVAFAVTFVLPPLVPVWLAGLWILRRRRGQPMLVDRRVRIAFRVVGWLGFALVLVGLVLAGISNSLVDEHAPAIIGGLLVYALFLIAGTDLALQGIAPISHRLTLRVRTR